MLAELSLKNLCSSIENERLKTKDAKIRGSFL